MTRQLLLASLVLAAAFVACGPSASQPDAGAGDDGTFVIPDAFGGPDFGQECTTSDDCDDGGYCVDGQNGNICTYGCDAGCPDRWNCRVADVAGTLVSLCMPEKFDFCKPCSADVQCSGGVCVQLDGEGFCLPDCPFEGQCPTGYACEPDPSGAHTGNYCVPQTGSCSCTAAEAGQVRTCETTNSVGTCFGFETCMPDSGGWSGCSAPTASPEVCDGLDNDCDQLIDDGVSGSACPITVSGVGTCQGVQICTGTSVVCQGPTPQLETCNYADDDCDTLIDETFPNLSAVCSAGIGGCERFGVYRCNSAGNDTECSAIAGTPQAERCNGLDDDCDTAIDETFTTLGQACSAGVGACARQGNLVCNANGTGTACSVTAGTPGVEACNGIDDDCDTRTDEGFLNQLTGLYDKDFACGSCAIDCTVQYAVPNATGVCVVSGTPQCQMVCAPNSFDLDNQSGNGCELVLDTNAIYVSTNDAQATDDTGCGLGPVGTGAGHYPCRTIAHGLARATVTGRANVRVANGIYPEAVTLVSGKQLLGGHRTDTWQRDVAATGTLVTGVATIASTNHDYTVRATTISAATTFEGFVVVGPVNAKTAGNSYAVYVAGGSTSLTIRSNVIYGGRGGPGTSGGAGAAGAAGVDGVGRVSNPSAYDARVASGTAPCDPINNRAYANGGVQTCSGDDVSGGNGGGNRCRPMALAEYSGLDGNAGQPGDPLLGGGAGGGADAGDDMRLFMSGPPMPSARCAIPTAPDYGANGTPGNAAAHGPAGPGCQAAGGSVVGGHWVGGSGGNGIAGGNGGGGGGGGAGGGAFCDGCQDGRDRLGGHGGGGGSGGCGGSGGLGASAGGGAFAIFIAGGAAPVVTNNSLVRGEGGAGGSGGAGGGGGGGGVGGAGGTSTEFCAGPAGRGGNGGNGGHGAGGGGGCGGGSFGIYTSGIGSPNYCTTAANTISSGAGGAGGAGGYSLINTGGAGSTGALVGCQFN